MNSRQTCALRPSDASAFFLLPGASVCPARARKKNGRIAPAVASMSGRPLPPKRPPTTESHFAYWFVVTRMLVAVLDFCTCGSLPFGVTPGLMPVIEISA